MGTFPNWKEFTKGGKMLVSIGVAYLFFILGFCVGAVITLLIISFK